MLHNRIATDQQTVPEQLQNATELATGILMERHQLAPNTAFERLRLR